MIKPLPNPLEDKTILFPTIKKVTLDSLWSYIKAYQNQIRDLGIKLEHHKIQSEYDRYSLEKKFLRP
jgi:hypothetical protein